MPGPLGIVLLLILGSATPGTWAADWMVTPSVTLREIYSDNITLAPDNERWELVTEINPGILVSGQGRRINANLDYNLQTILFPSGNFDDEVNHQLDADVVGELIEQLFFIDVEGVISQTNADNTRRLASNNISQTGNRINTYAYRLSPFMRNHFGSYAHSEIRYSFDEVINEGATVDSKAHELRGEIDSGSEFVRLPWQIFAEARDVDFDDGTKTEFRQAGSGLRYVFGRRFSIFGRGGYELQDFGTARNDEDGIFWQAGATWTPSPRTKFDGGYGKRYFGHNFFFTIQQDTRRSVLRASFKEDISLTGTTGLAGRLGSIGQFRIPTNQPTPTSEVLVTQRFDGSFALSGLRTKLDVTGYHENRDFQDTGDEETVFGATTVITRNLSPRMILRLGGIWEETKFRDRVREDTRWEINARLERRLGPSSDGSIEYQYTSQDSNVPASEFQENRVILSLTVTF